jgi:ankyrin repeat protein
VKSLTATVIPEQTLSGGDDHKAHALNNDNLEETLVDDDDLSGSSSDEEEMHFVTANSSPSMFEGARQRSAMDIFNGIRFMKAARDPKLAGREVIVANVRDLREALERDRRLAQTRTDDGWTALQCLIRFGAGYRAVDCAWLLLDAHPSAAQEPAPDGWLPLHLALRPLESAEPVLEPDSCTGLIVEGYMLEILSLLLSSNPTAVSEKTPNGDLPLHLAARYTGGYGSVECMYMLLQAHPMAAQERNADGDLPLHIAARDMYGSRSAECMRLLLQVYPAGAREQSSSGNLPLHDLVETKSDYDAAACVRVLAAAYPQALHHENQQGQTPLEIAKQWMQPDAEVLAELRRLNQDGE